MRKAWLLLLVCLAFLTVSAFALDACPTTVIGSENGGTITVAEDADCGWNVGNIHTIQAVGSDKFFENKPILYLKMVSHKDNSGLLGMGGTDEWAMEVGVPGGGDGKREQWFLKENTDTLTTFKFLPGLEVKLDMDHDAGWGGQQDSLKITLNKAAVATLKKAGSVSNSTTQANQAGVPAALQGIEQGGKPITLTPIQGSPNEFTVEGLERAEFTLRLTNILPNDSQPAGQFFFFNEQQTDFDKQLKVGADFDQLVLSTTPLVRFNNDLSSSAGYMKVDAQQCKYNPTKQAFESCRILVKTHNGKPWAEFQGDSVTLALFSNFEEGADKKQVIGEKEAALITVKFKKREVAAPDVSIAQKNEFGVDQVKCTVAALTQGEVCKLSASRPFTLQFESARPGLPIYFNAEKSQLGRISIQGGQKVAIDAAAGGNIDKITAKKMQVSNIDSISLNTGLDDTATGESGYYYIDTANCPGKITTAGKDQICPVSVDKLDGVELSKYVKGLRMVVFADVNPNKTLDEKELRTITIQFVPDADSAPCTSILQCLALIDKQLAKVFDADKKGAK